MLYSNGVMNEVGVWLECIQESSKNKIIDPTTVAGEPSSTVWAAVHGYQRLSHPFQLAEALLSFPCSAGSLRFSFNIRQYLKT